MSCLPYRQTPLKMGRRVITPTLLRKGTTTYVTLLTQSNGVTITLGWAAILGQLVKLVLYVTYSHIVTV